MNPLEATIAELQREMESTKKLLALVPLDKLDWKPHAKSMPIGELAKHIATLPGGLGSKVTEDGFDFADRTPPPEGTDYCAILDAGVAKAIANIRTVDPASLMDDWSMKMDGKVLLTVPRIAVLRTLMLNHIYHHRGQLTVYLRLLDIPLPSIYGPTADVNPFF